ncbi:MAG TPA: glyceraldehyde-3-phosphate dehydrogenase [Rhizobacter sp.]|nr:glyceraldehyde-3-phosphate dehydrogenase [Rhizobacter sp.]
MTHRDSAHSLFSLPRKLGIMAALLAGLCQPSHAFLDEFKDPDDGYLDLSTWLVERKGFLPVPIIITEPAIGVGGGVAFLFLRNSMRESAEKARETGLHVAPDIWAVGGFGTDNGTKMAFAGGMKSFDEGRWKYRGGVGRADIKLDFYGIGNSDTGANGIAYALDGWASMQQMLYRLGQTDNWLGMRWIYLDLNSALDISNRPGAGLLPDETTKRGSGLGLTLEHDSRDSIFTPSRGWKGGIDATFYDPDWGSDTRFQSYRGHVFAYWPAMQELVVAGRLDGRSVNGKTPFYMLPFIDMRGIPAARYQDDNTSLIETELRWNVTPRWGAVGFLGAGRVWGRNKDFDEASTVVSKGVGMRYLLANRLNLWVGLDYARGPEGGVGYIIVGNAWK